MTDVVGLKELCTALLLGAGAAGCSAVYFDTNKYDIGWGALLGGAGWVCCMAVGGMSGFTPAGYATGAFCVSLCSEILAYIIKNPATVYLLPGLLPLVPGGGMFYTMRAAVHGQADEALASGFTTLTAACAIAAGIALASSLARIASLTAHAVLKKSGGKNRRISG